MRECYFIKWSDEIVTVWANWVENVTEWNNNEWECHW